MEKQAVEIDNKKERKLLEFINNTKKLAYSKRLPTGKNGDLETYDVYKVPIIFLSFNFKNTRIASELIGYLEKKKVELNSNDPDQIKEVQRILLHSRWFGDMRTKALMIDIKERGQLDPAVARSDGVLIDGNRRLAIMQFYSKEFPDEIHFQNMEICILKDGTTEDQLKELEIRLQMSQEQKVGYGDINTAIEFRNLSRILGWEFKHIRDVTNNRYKEPKIINMIRTIDIIDECLEIYPPIGKNRKQYNILEKGWESFSNLINIIKFTEKNYPNDERILERIKLFGFQLIMNPKTTYEDVRTFNSVLRVDESRKELEYLSDTLKGKKLDSIFNEARMENERRNLEAADFIREGVIESPLHRALDALKKIESIKVSKSGHDEKELISVFDAIIKKISKLKEKIM